MSSNTSNIITELVSLARFSPSSHNTQPWTVKIDASAAAITIGYDLSRQLKFGDPENRELFLTLGCFIETLICAASDRGLEATYDFISQEPSSVARVTFKPAEATNEWVRLIQKRRSDRRLYEQKPLPSDVSSELSGINRGQASLLLVDNIEDIAFLAKMTEESTFKIMSDKNFRNELASWVRTNYTKQQDGMPGYTQGMPGPVSLLGPWFIRNMKPVPADQAKKDANRVSHSAVIGLVCIPENSFNNWVDAGRVYQAACLNATKYDIKTTGVSAAIVEETSTATIVSYFKLNNQPVALMRFGYKEGQVRRTNRLPVTDFTSY